MKRFLVVLVLFCAFVGVEANAEEKAYNPGYFVSRGFVSFGISGVHPKSGSYADSRFLPSAMGNINIIQSEYGNLGLTLGASYTRPAREYEQGNYKFRMIGDEYIADVGLAYSTGSKSINLWLGGGYVKSWLSSKMDEVYLSGVGTGYTKRFRSTRDGHYLFGALEYVISKDGKWGLGLVVRSQETSVAHYKDATLGTKVWQNVDAMTYQFSLYYHF
ncbi:hypothetical protein RsTz2092_05610 [Deferribacterales bacterium RsTz2092]|nr:hypothetical protein AGMMS49941_10260 [Deferribacterales bacterium]